MKHLKKVHSQGTDKGKEEDEHMGEVENEESKDEDVEEVEDDRDFPPS